jgi:nitrate reductase gamma subunit
MLAGLLHISALPYLDNCAACIAVHLRPLVCASVPTGLLEYELITTRTHQRRIVCIGGILGTILVIALIVWLVRRV